MSSFWIILFFFRSSFEFDLVSTRKKLLQSRTAANNLLRHRGILRRILSDSCKLHQERESSRKSSSKLVWAEAVPVKISDQWQDTGSWSIWILLQRRTQLFGAGSLDGSWVTVRHCIRRQNLEQYTTDCLHSGKKKLWILSERFLKTFL